MEEIGSFEAKNRLSELLSRVEKGESILITRRGKAVALLTSADKRTENKQLSPKELLATFRAFREKGRIGPETLKMLIEEGRQ